jgi:hypothetical protein
VIFIEENRNECSVILFPLIGKRKLGGKVIRGERKSLRRNSRVYRIAGWETQGIGDIFQSR